MRAACTALPTAALGSSQAPTAAVDKAAKRSIKACSSPSAHRLPTRRCAPRGQPAKAAFHADRGHLHYHRRRHSGPRAAARHRVERCPRSAWTAARHRLEWVPAISGMRTYLIAGEIMHRDGLGNVQAIRPGEVNWMTAGSGIVHSERTPEAERRPGASLFGIQAWVALPKAHEEAEPAFFHHAAAAIPKTESDGAALTLIAGRSDGLVSPVRTYSDMVYADIVLEDAARYQVKAEHVERAVYVVSGALEVLGQAGRFEAGELVVFKPGAELVLRGAGATRLMLIGGEPLAEPRHI
nr:pirin family protein [Achromobacter sp.]